jgi:hypothetical protein
VGHGTRLAGRPEDGHRDAARHEGNDHRDDQGDVDQGGRGQAADQRGGDDEQRPADRGRAARIAGSVRSVTLAVTAVRAHWPGTWGVTW